MEKQDQQSQKEFTPPRHWVTMDELSPSYWDNDQEQKLRAQEFLHKPIETLEKLDKEDTSGLQRREFLTIMGASMAMAGLSCARRPVNKIIPYVNRSPHVTPGIPTWYASTAPNGYGVLIKNREGRPIKLEGNPDHPVNRGKLDVRTQASLLDLYDPDRLKNPVLVGESGKLENSNWGEADSIVSSKLSEAAKKRGAVRFLSGNVTSPSRKKIISEFLSAFSNSRHVEFDPTCSNDVADGQRACYGSGVVPDYRFEKAEVVLSLGADFLGSWGESVAHANRWSELRKLKSSDHSGAKMSQLFSVESSFSSTGASADQRFAVRAGDELKVAMAVAHEIIVAKGRSRFAGVSSLKSVLQTYDADRVANEIGFTLKAENIKEMADALWKARGKSLVVAGGVNTASDNQLVLQVAVNLLNSALENDGKTVVTSQSVSRSNGYEEFTRLLDEMKAGRIDVLILHQANLLYQLPESFGLNEAINQVPFVVSISDRVDETSRLANVVLPEHHYLENWGDCEIRRNLVSLQQPAIAPIHDTRAMEDLLIGWAKSGKLGTRGVLSGIVNGSKTWHDYLKDNWRRNIGPRFGGGGETFWQESLRKGVVGREPASTNSARSFNFKALGSLPKNVDAPSETMLTLYTKNSMGNGSQANNAWLQEVPDAISTVTWDNYLNISPAMAQASGLKSNDVVLLKADSIEAKVPVNVLPGMHPKAMSLAVGYGRTSVGNVGNKCGVNAYRFSRRGISGVSFTGGPVTIAKTGASYELAATQRHNRTENRPVINDISIDEFRNNPKTENHTEPHLRLKSLPTLWPKHKYPGYRWGMAIDLNGCNGCGACIVACQAENNIPVVGRNQVRVSREMHWIRIDRYFSGSAEQPRVAFQPMLCQHCENAPCETVCPVLATVHSSEGTNDMAYNRCVGTRYCQNNCPYKVRRFNFFDHYKDYVGPMNLVWNPDVTVRMRGVMEKCTFCTQRVYEAKQKAKDKGRDVKDGDFQTACQQTCPTNAISFGNMNDSGSEVSQLKADARGFHSLEELNVRPSVTYLTKVRNVKKEAMKHDDHHHS